MDAASASDARTERYRQAERALWGHYGLEPTERFIDVASPRVRLRVVEVGAGEPVLFVPGTAGTGPYWGALIRELKGFRCLMLDRPGWGLSSPVDYSKYGYKTVVADVLRGALDALGLDRAHVAGASIGGVWPLRLAAAQPSRVGRIVLLGGGPLVPEILPPAFVRLLASPLGAIIVRLPQRSRMVRSILRQGGHGASLDAGRIPDVFVDWRVALGRDTDSMRNERDMIRTLVSGRTFRPGSRSRIRSSPQSGIRRSWCTAPPTMSARSTSGGEPWACYPAVSCTSWMELVTFRGSTSPPRSVAASATSWRSSLGTRSARSESSVSR